METIKETEKKKHLGLVQMKKEDWLKLLLNDLERLHIESTITLSEKDGEALNKINKNEIKNNKDFFEIRNKLWVGYIEEILAITDNLIQELSKYLVKVKDYKIRLQRIRGNINIVKINISDKKSLKNIQEEFKKSMSLFNSLIVSESDLKNEAWKGFLLKLFLPFATVISGIYGWVIYNYYNNLPFPDVALYWVFVMILTYMGLNGLAKRHSELKDDETSET